MKNPSFVTSYGIVRQVKLTGSIDEYEQELRDFHHRYRSEAERILGDYERDRSDILVKTAQVTRGSLNQFLSTPIKSDNEEVQRIIKEGFEKFSEQILAHRSATLTSFSWEARILMEYPPDEPDPAMRKLLARGKKRLRNGGFTLGKNSWPVFESVFVAKGTLTLNDVDGLLKQLERQQGEGGSPYRVESERVVYEFKDSVAAEGDSTATPGVWEADVVFDAQGLEPMEERFALICKTLTKEFNIHHISFWKKKFIYTKHNEMNLLVRMIPDLKHLGEIVRRISTHDDGEIAGRIIQGAMIIKEIIV